MGDPTTVKAAMRRFRQAADSPWEHHAATALVQATEELVTTHIQLQGSLNRIAALAYSFSGVPHLGHSDNDGSKDGDCAACWVDDIGEALAVREVDPHG